MKQPIALGGALSERRDILAFVWQKRARRAGITTGRGATVIWYLSWQPVLVLVGGAAEIGGVEER